MGNGAAAVRQRWHCDFPDTKVVGSHWVGCPVPGVCCDKRVTWGRKRRLTELADEVGLLRVWSPFAVGDAVVWAHIEAKTAVSLGEFFVSALVLVDRVLPAAIGIVSLNYGGDIGPEISIDVENGLWVEGL